MEDHPAGDKQLVVWREGFKKDCKRIQRVKQYVHHHVSSARVSLHISLLFL